MNISVVIPTYKREKDLEECLDSIATQRRVPQEIVVVDSGREDRINQLVLKKTNAFQKLGIVLKYVRNERENSASVARNIGVGLASGDYICLVDDDTVLPQDYLKNIIRFFEEHTDALCVSGVTTGNLSDKNWLKFLLAQALGKIFLLGFNEKNRCRVLPPITTTNPFGDDIIPAEWLSGSSLSCKRRIFTEFSFDEKLKKYSWGDDIDFGNRVYQKYPNALFFDPRIKFIHKISKEGRTIGKEKVYVE